MTWLFQGKEPVDPGGVITDGLVGRWILDDGPDTYADWYINGLDGEKGSTTAPTPEPGLVCSHTASIFVPASAQSSGVFGVKVPHNSLLSFTNARFSYIGFIHLTQTQTSYDRHIFSKSQFTEDQRETQIRITANTSFVRFTLFPTRVTGGQVHLDSSSNLPLDTTVCLYVGWDGAGNGELYFDDTLEASVSNSLTSIQGGTADVTMGYVSTEGQNIYGIGAQLQDWRIYDRPLTPQERLAIRTCTG